MAAWPQPSWYIFIHHSPCSVSQLSRYWPCPAGENSKEQKLVSFMTWVAIHTYGLLLGIQFNLSSQCFGGCDLGPVGCRSVVAKKSASHDFSLSPTAEKGRGGKMETNWSSSHHVGKCFPHICTLLTFTGKGGMLLSTLCTSCWCSL